MTMFAARRRHVRMRTYLALLVVALVISLSAAIPGSQTSAGPEFVIFTATQADGRVNLDAVQADGGPLRVVTVLPARSSLLAVHGGSALAALPGGRLAIVGLVNGALSFLPVSGATAIGPFAAFSPGGDAVLFEVRTASQAAPQIEVADLLTGTARNLHVSSSLVGYTAGWTGSGPVVIQRTSFITLNVDTGRVTSIFYAPQQTLYVQFRPQLTNIAVTLHTAHIGDDTIASPNGSPLGNSILLMTPPSNAQQSVTTVSGHDFRPFDVDTYGNVLVGDASYAESSSKVVLRLLMLHADGSSTVLLSSSNIRSLVLGTILSRQAAIVGFETSSIGSTNRSVNIKVARVSAQGGQSTLATITSQTPLGQLLVTTY